jgi:hypothetical protein
MFFTPQLHEEALRLRSRCRCHVWCWLAILTIRDKRLRWSLD